MSNLNILSPVNWIKAIQDSQPKVTQPITDRLTLEIKFGEASSRILETRNQAKQNAGLPLTSDALTG